MSLCEHLAGGGRETILDLLDDSVELGLEGLDALVEAADAGLERLHHVVELHLVGAGPLVQALLELVAADLQLLEAEDTEPDGHVKGILGELDDLAGIDGGEIDGGELGLGHGFMIKQSANNCKHFCPSPGPRCFGTRGARQ